MSKRTDAIRAMCSVAPAEALSADNKIPALPRVSSGSVRSLKETFSGVERENEELRARLASALTAIEIDPALIDPSPLADRFAEQEAGPFEALKTSIRERGQEIPVLVREHPTLPGRYQSAYGHRRVRAARELGLAVKAYVRPMSDEELVVAQGLENSAREDLSFIERAAFAVRLEAAGFQRSVIQTALSVDRAEASKLVAVAEAIPADLVAAIGRAPKIGRGRWQALAERLKAPASLKRARAAVKRHGFAEDPSDARFLSVLAASGAAAESSGETPAPQAIASKQGREIARAAYTPTQLKLTLDRSAHAGFAAYLIEKLPDLFEAYAESAGPDDQREA